VSIFEDLQITVDAAAIEQSFYDQMAEAFPGWVPSKGNIEVYIVKWASRLIADLAQLSQDVAAQIFIYFGQELLGLVARQGLPAQALTTWTMVDDAGYTIPAGTQVVIPASGSDFVGFTVTQEVSVAPGETETETGEVALTATVLGEQGNGLEGVPNVSDALSFVASIELEATTNGGVDAETGPEYLDRLTLMLKTLSFTPILAEDVAILVRTLPDVARVRVLDNYDPDTDTFGHEKMIAFAAIDAVGQDIDGATKTAAEEMLTALREQNYIFNAIDPERTAVKVTMTFVAYPNFDPAAVKTNAEAEIAGYLSSANWAKGPALDAATWEDENVVRRNELIALADRVPGVRFVATMQLAKQADALGAVDVTLDGVAPLPTPGTIIATPV
jgi:hypothetical protein